MPETQATESEVEVSRGDTHTSPRWWRSQRAATVATLAIAVIALALWLTAAGGEVTLPSAFAPLVWHRHEMLFGFVGAVIAGFLLTAIPNWTGRPAIAG